MGNHRIRLLEAGQGPGDLQLQAAQHDDRRRHVQELPLGRQVREAGAAAAVRHLLLRRRPGVRLHRRQLRGDPRQLRRDGRQEVLPDGRDGSQGALLQRQGHRRGAAAARRAQGDQGRARRVMK